MNYYIWNNERRMWWREAKWGYTTNIDLAGVYTHDEAMSICQQAALGGEFDDLPVLTDDANQIAKIISDHPRNSPEETVEPEPVDPPVTMSQIEDVLCEEERLLLTYKDGDTADNDKAVIKGMIASSLARIRFMLANGVKYGE